MGILPDVRKSKALKEVNIKNTDKVPHIKVERRNPLTKSKEPKKTNKSSSRRTRQLLVKIYPSGQEGVGRSKSKIVNTTLTKKQYKRKFYSSKYHEDTEYAMTVKEIK